MYIVCLGEARDRFWLFSAGYIEYCLFLRRSFDPSSCKFSIDLDTYQFLYLSVRILRTTPLSAALYQRNEHRLGFRLAIKMRALTYSL